MNPAIVLGAVALAGALIASMRAEEAEMAVGDGNGNGNGTGQDVEAEITDKKTGDKTTTIITGASDAALDALADEQEQEMADQFDASEDEGYGVPPDKITAPRYVFGTPDYTAVLRA